MIHPLHFFCIQDEALNLFQELQRQARNTTKYESQVQAASQRVTELELAMEQLQLENQRLLAFGSAERSSSLQPAIETQPYGTDSSLSLSAMEQQLSVAEEEVADLHELLSRLGKEKQQLAAEVQNLEVAMTAARKDLAEAVSVFEAASGLRAQDVLNQDLVRKVGSLCSTRIWSGRWVACVEPGSGQEGG
jgi:regulator of replication initiation timing